MAGEGKLGSRIVKPGETFSLPVKFTTSTAQETASARIDVRYKDAAHAVPEFEAELNLFVRADVLPDYRLTPTLLDLGTVDGLTTQTVTRTFRFEPAAVPEVAVTAVRTSREFLTVKLVRDDDGLGAEVEVAIDVSKFFQSRRLDGMVVLETTSKRVPNAVIDVRGRYQAAIEAEPDAIVISSAEQGEQVRKIRFVSMRPSLITKVSSSSRALGTKWSGEQLATQHTVKLRVPAEEEAALEAELVVEFEFPDVDESGGSARRTVAVPVYRFPFQENGHDQAD